MHVIQAQGRPMRQGDVTILRSVCTPLLGLDHYSIIVSDWITVSQKKKKTSFTNEKITPNLV